MHQEMLNPLIKSNGFASRGPWMPHEKFHPQPHGLNTVPSAAVLRATAALGALENDQLAHALVRRLSGRRNPP